MKKLLIALLLPSTAALGASVSAFQEEMKNSNDNPGEYKKMLEENIFGEKELEGVLRKKFKRISDTITVPGTASSVQMASIAKVVGPMGIATSFRVGDTIFLRWVGAPGPREGDRYSVFSPAIILQSLQNPADFSVVTQSENNEKNERYRQAGYFYESSGGIRITRITQGLVEAVVEKMSGPISVGDQIMPPLPRLTLPKPVYQGVQLSAAIVSGSPVERLSPTPRSFIYINRGSRDGITIGRVFQSLETAKIENSKQGPEMLAGEAIVVHTDDAFSVAMITKQFEVIRLGSLLKSKQTENEIPSLQPFVNFKPGQTAKNSENSNVIEEVEEVPNLNELKAATDPSLPDPLEPKPLAPPPPPLPELPVEPPMPEPPAAPELSELDEIEQSNKFNALSEREKERLGTLSKQEKVGEQATEDDDAPMLSPIDNSFGSPKPAEKKKKKKRAQKSRDEEELNLLMMQN